MKRDITIFFIIIIFASCNFGHDKKDNSSDVKITNIKTGLWETCTKIIKVLDNSDHDIIGVNASDKTHISLDSLTGLIYDITKYDIAFDSNFNTYQRNCSNISIITWTSNSQNSQTTKIERLTYKTEINFSNNKTNEITITDYNIFIRTNPNYIMLRLVNEDEFELLIINKTKYSLSRESRILGLDEIIGKFDSIKNACL